MRALKRKCFVAVLVLGLSALGMPFLLMRAYASRSAAPASSSALKSASPTPSLPVSKQDHFAGQEKPGASREDRVSSDTLSALGIKRVANPGEVSKRIRESLKNKGKKPEGDLTIQSGSPLVLNSRSALSDALITALGGR
ncbi:MAG: hypothetical protein WAV20_19245, partial [Blastocatellia bacterium]